MGHFETPKQFFRSLDADVAGALIAAAVDEFALSVSLFQQVSATHLRLRLSALGLALQEPVASGRQMLLKVMESAPDAFVVTDLDDRISTVNYAFLDLVQLASEEMVRNETLEKWLDRTGVDLNLLISKLGQGGAARLFATTMRGEYGSTADVQISAVAVNSGFTLRDVGRRLTSDTRANRELPRSASQMTELVGRVQIGRAHV